MFPVLEVQEKVANIEREHWCLDGGIKPIHALQSERFCGFVIHTDLPGCCGGRSPLKVMSNLICKAVFLTVFSSLYITWCS